jgi:hypothetical protein
VCVDEEALQLISRVRLPATLPSMVVACMDAVVTEIKKPGGALFTERRARA